MKHLRKITLCFSLIFCLGAHAQIQPAANDMSINAAIKNEVIKNLNQEMQKKYVYLEMEKKSKRCC